MLILLIMSENSSHLMKATCFNFEGYHFLKQQEKIMFRLHLPNFTRNAEVLSYLAIHFHSDW